MFQVFASLALITGAQPEAETCRPIMDPPHFMIFFDTGSASITKGAAPILDHAAVAFPSLERCDATTVYLVAGHSDGVGSAVANRRLSCERALAARAYLLTKGLRPERLIPIGFGADRPNVPTPGGNPEQQNRYVDLEVTGREYVQHHSVGATRC